ncbi:MAG: histidine phosphatase family protein [Roseiarcus sp.]
MRRLLLLRHAKAMHPAGRGDYERALVERGRRDAARIGAFLAEAGMIPDLAIFSGALRTRETAAIVLKAWPQRIEARAEPSLYDATRASVQAIVRALPDTAASVLLIGHNPGLADLANHLVGGGAERDIARMVGKFPTAGLAALEFDFNRWREVAPGSARLARFVTPDDLSVASG